MAPVEAGYFISGILTVGWKPVALMVAETAFLALMFVGLLNL